VSVEGLEECGAESWVGESMACAVCQWHLEASSQFNKYAGIVNGMRPEELRPEIDESEWFVLFVRR
jgi:hypothetical protein